MKRLVLLAAAVAAIASCAKVETFNTSQPELISINAVNSHLTKTAQTLDALNDGSMGVFANQAGLEKAYLTNTKFTKGGVSQKWEGDAYWPNTGSLDFVVYAPYSNAMQTTTGNTSKSRVAITGTKATGIVLDYKEVPEKDDLLYGTTIPTAQKSNKSVAVTLSHAKAKICFNAKANVSNVYSITSVTLNKSVAKGDAKVTYAAEGASVSSVEWTKSSEGEQTVPEQTLAPTDGLALTDSYAPITNPTTDPEGNPLNTEAINGVFVLPSDQTSFTINYTMNGKECAPAEFILGGKWEMGKKYTYNVTFTADKIYFDPTVTDWDNDDAGTEEDFNHPEQTMSFTTIKEGEPVPHAPTLDLGIYAWEGSNPYFANVLGTHSTGSWTTDYNWPVKANTAMFTKPLKFVAYSGRTTESEENNANCIKTDGNKIIIDNVTVPASTTAVDKLLQVGTGTQIDNGTAPVNFNFKPAFTVLRILAQANEGADTNPFTITKIELENVVNQGKITITDQGAMSWEAAMSTQAKTEIGNLTGVISNGTINKNHTAQVLGYFYIIPFDYTPQYPYVGEGQTDLVPTLKVTLQRNDGLTSPTAKVVAFPNFSLNYPGQIFDIVLTLNNASNEGQLSTGNNVVDWTTTPIDKVALPAIR